MNKIIITIIAIAAISATASAQSVIKYWDHDSYLNIGGGMVTPGEYLSDTSANGFYADKGFQVDFDYNYIFGYGLGIGGNIEYDQFKFNGQSFLNQTNADEMNVDGGYSSTKFGLNLVANIPIVIVDDGFTVNFFGEFNAGIRSFNIPSIDLYYNEVVNNFVEVSYRSRGNTMGYLGYSAGIQFLIVDRFGINVSYNAVLPSRHSVKYSVRMFDAMEQLSESETYINNYLDHTGIQFGLMFIFGKKH